MNYQLDKRLSLLEKKLGVSDMKEVTYVILGDNESYAVANGEVMGIDEFNTKYPNFKPSGISIVVGEWDES